jgi:hypothetical protein
MVKISGALSKHINNKADTLGIAIMTPDERKAEIDSLNDSAELDRLYDDIRTEVSRDLRNFRAREEELSAIATDQLLMMYMNWKFRQIHPHPRKVLLSAEILNRKQSNDPLIKPFEKQFDRLMDMIGAGEDLTPLLSRAVLYKPYELKPNFARLKDERHLDLLLNEQGIHHLHLPTLEQKKGTPIVFGIFDRHEAFLLDVAPNDDWSSDRLARISYSNWPQRHFFQLQIDGLADNQGTRITLTDQQRVSVRNNAINTPIEIDNGLFVRPRAGGLAANGYSGSVVRRAIDIWNSLPLFVIRSRRPGFAEYFEQQFGKPLPANPDFRFRFLDVNEDWQYAIVEGDMAAAFLLPNYFGVAKG